MKILICGAGGMLGRDLLKAAAGHHVAALTHGELDVTDADTVRGAVERARRDAVVNCAAWTDVTGPRRSRSRRCA